MNDKKNKDSNKTGAGGGQYNNNNAETWTEKDALELGNKLIKWAKSEPEYEKIGNNLVLKDPKIHYVKFLFDEYSLYPSTIQHLTKKFVSFCNLKKNVIDIIKYKKLQLAETNKINTTMTIFDLKNNHGMLEKNVNLNMEGEKITYESFLENIINDESKGD